MTDSSLEKYKGQPMTQVFACFRTDNHHLVQFKPNHIDEMFVTLIGHQMHGIAQVESILTRGKEDGE